MTTGMNIGSNESITSLLQKLNSLDVNNSKGVSQNELSTIQTETSFTNALSTLFYQTDKDANGEITEQEFLSNKENILGQIGAPATFGLEASSSVTSKLKNLDILKALDINKDNKININDLTTAKEKSPLIDNLTKAFKSADSDNKIGNFLSNIMTQYGNNPLNILEDVVEVFA